MTIGKYCIDLPEVVKVSPSDTLQNLLPKLDSSHWPSFVMEDDKLVGIVWLHHVLFKKRPDPASQIKSYMIKPPQITKKTSLAETIRTMLDLRLYMLPVITARNEIEAVVTARNILEQIFKDGIVSARMTARLQPTPAFGISEETNIKSLFGKMRQNNVSRAIVTDSSRNIKGIVSRRDIYTALLFFADQTGGRGRSARTTVFNEKIFEKANLAVSKIINRQVTILPVGSDIRMIFGKLVSGNIGSVVLVNQYRQPVSIVSYRNLLKALSDALQEYEIPIIVTDKNESLDAFRRMELEDLLQASRHKMAKHQKVQRINLTVGIITKAGVNASRYDISLQVYFTNGQIKLSKAENHDLRVATNEAIDKILRQLTD